MKALRTLLKGLAVLFLALVVCTLVVLQWPSILINSHTLSMAARFANKRQGMTKIHWNQVRVESHHRGLFSNQLAFHFQNLCFEDPSYGHGCFEDLNAAFAYGIQRALPRLIELGPVKGYAKDITLQVPKKAAAKSSTLKPSRATSQKSPVPEGLIADAKLEPIDVQVDHWSFTLPNLQLAGTYSLHGGPAESPSTGAALTSKINMDIASHAMKGALDSKAQITARAESPSNRLISPWKGQIDFHAYAPELQTKLATLALITPGQNGHIDFQVKNHYFSPLGQANLDLLGWTVPNQEVKGELRGQFEPAQSQRNAPLSLLSLLQMNRFQLKGCRFDLHQPDSGNQDGRLTSDCFVDTQIVRFRLYGKQQPPIKLWRELGVLAKSDIKLPAPAHSSTPIQGQVSFEPRADKSSSLQVGGQVASHFELMPAEAPVPRQLNTHIDVSAGIPDFQKLVKTLWDTPVAIPAPLRTLKGPVSTSMRGDLTLKEGGNLAVDMSTHLNHAPDHLNVKGNGNVAIEALRTLFDRPPRLPEVDAKMDILLSDIHLTLPKTGISMPPEQVLPDPRIHTTTPTASSAVVQNTQHGELAGIRYVIHVTTPADHPVQIATQYLKKPVTVGLDLRLRQGQPWMGFAEINGNKEPVGIPSSEMAGQAATERSGPKLPFGFSQLASSLLTGVPFQGITTQPETGQGVIPQKEEERVGSMIELRRRY